MVPSLPGAARRGRSPSEEEVERYLEEERWWQQLDRLSGVQALTVVRRMDGPGEAGQLDSLVAGACGALGGVHLLPLCLWQRILRLPVLLQGDDGESPGGGGRRLPAGVLGRRRAW